MSPCGWQCCCLYGDCDRSKWTKVCEKCIQFEFLCFQFFNAEATSQRYGFLLVKSNSRPFKSVVWADARARAPAYFSATWPLWTPEHYTAWCECGSAIATAESLRCKDTFWDIRMFFLFCLIVCEQVLSILVILVPSIRYSCEGLFKNNMFQSRKTTLCQWLDRYVVVAFAKVTCNYLRVLKFDWNESPSKFCLTRL